MKSGRKEICKYIFNCGASGIMFNYFLVILFSFRPLHLDVYAMT